MSIVESRTMSFKTTNFEEATDVVLNQIRYPNREIILLNSKDKKTLKPHELFLNFGVLSIVFMSWLITHSRRTIIIEKETNL